MVMGAAAKLSCISMHGLNVIKRPMHSRFHVCNRMQSSEFATIELGIQFIQSNRMIMRTI